MESQVLQKTLDDQENCVPSTEIKKSGKTIFDKKTKADLIEEVKRWVTENSYVLVFTIKELNSSSSEGILNRFILVPFCITPLDANGWLNEFKNTSLLFPLRQANTSFI